MSQASLVYLMRKKQISSTESHEPRLRAQTVPIENPYVKPKENPYWEIYVKPYVEPYMEPYVEPYVEPCVEPCVEHYVKPAKPKKGCICLIQ